MNNVAGIDVSKGKSMVSVLRPFGEVVAKPFSIGHTGSELKELADYLKSLDGETRVVMEHTGRYYEPVARFLHDEGVFVSAVNPKLIKDYGNNTLRKVKTDKADSRKIARYGIDNWAELRQHTPMDTIRMQLKTLNRQQSLYTKTKTMMKNNLIALLDQTYPGVSALFDSPVREDGSQKWVDFATTFWHVDCVRNMSLTAFAERYRKWCKRHGYNFSQSKAVEVHAGAQDLIAMLPRDALTKTMIRKMVTYLCSRFDDQVSSILHDIVDTPVSPELLPPDESGKIQQKTEDILGSYTLHDFFLYCTLRYGFSPRRIYFLAKKAFTNHTSETILKWLRIFFRRFFNQQFKRSCLPDGPKVGSVCLSPRGDWRMPSDASAKMWLKEIDELRP